MKLSELEKLEKLEKEGGYQVTHADADKGGDEACQLEGVVQHIFADAGGSCAVEADGGYLGGICRDIQ